MKTSTLTCLALLGAVAVLAIPTTVWADHTASISNEDRVIRKLLIARDDDDREDAADALAKWGSARALSALNAAAIHDEEDDVRRHAKRAANKIRDRLGIRVVTTHRPTIAHRTPVVTTHRPAVTHRAPAVRRPAVVLPPVVHRRPVVVHPPVRRRPVVVHPPVRHRPVVVRRPVRHRPVVVRRPVVVHPPEIRRHKYGHTNASVRIGGGRCGSRSSVGFRHGSSNLGIGFSISF